MPNTIPAESSNPLAAEHGRALAPDDAKALLRDCCREFTTRLFEATRASLDLASDLFETATGVPDAWELGSGRAALVVEPVPLFDRAVSAALDSLAARRPPQKAAA